MGTLGIKQQSFSHLNPAENVHTVNIKHLGQIRLVFIQQSYFIVVIPLSVGKSLFI